MKKGRHNMNEQAATLEREPSASPSTAQQPASAPVAARQESEGQTAEDCIRLSAYLKWEAAGKPAGNDTRFWLDAEREIQQAK